MIIRNYLKSTVCALVTLSLVSFALIFIISQVLIENLHDNIKQYTPLVMQNKTTWGEIPGTLNYNYTKSLYLFNIENSTSTSHVTLTTIGPLDYEVQRQFVDPVYDGARKVINYTMNYDYKLSESTSASKEHHKVQTVNLEAEAIWFQLNYNRPEFFKAWQAMALASSTMLAQDILSTLYAYQAFEYFFNSATNVYEGVLAEFTSSQQLHIYHDTKFGMDSVHKLILWTTATDGQAEDKRAA